MSLIFVRSHATRTNPITSTVRRYEILLRNISSPNFEFRISKLVVVVLVSCREVIDQTRNTARHRTNSSALLSTGNCADCCTGSGATADDKSGLLERSFVFGL